MRHAQLVTVKLKVNTKCYADSKRNGSSYRQNTQKQQQPLILV